MKPRKRLLSNYHIENPKEETMSCLICGKKKGICSHTHIRSQPDRQRETMDDRQEPSVGGMKGLIAEAWLAKKKISGNISLSSAAISSGHNKQEDCQLKRKNDAHNVILMTSTPHHNEDSHGVKDQEILTMKPKTLDELKTDASHQDFTCLMSKKQRIDERAIANNKDVKFECTTNNNSSTQKTLGGQRSDQAMHGRSDCCKTCNKFNCKGCKKYFSTLQAMGGHRSSQYQGKIMDGPEKSALANDKAVEEENQSAGFVTSLTSKVGNHQSKVCNKLLPRGHALGRHQSRCQSDAPSVIEAPTTFGPTSSTHSKKQDHHQLEHKNDARNLITSTFHYDKHLPLKKRKLLDEHQRCRSVAPSVIEAPTTFGAISSTHSKKQDHHQLEHKNDARNLITSTFHYDKHLPPKKRKLLYEHQRCQPDAPSVKEAPTTFGANSSTHSKKQDNHQLEHRCDAQNLITSTCHQEKNLPLKDRKLLCLYDLKQSSSYQAFLKEHGICERTEAQDKNGKSAAEEAINAKSRVGFDDKKRVNMVTSGAGCEYLDNRVQVEGKSARAPISKSNNNKTMAPVKMASTKKEMAEGGTSGINYKQNSSMTFYNDKIKCIGSEIAASANDDALQSVSCNAGSFTDRTRTVGRSPWNKSFSKSVPWGHKRSCSGAPQGIKHPTASTSFFTGGGTSGIDYKQNSSMTSYNDEFKSIGSEISALANDDALQAESRNAGSFTDRTRTVGRSPWTKSSKSVTWGHKRSSSGAPQGIKHSTATTSSLAASQKNIQSKTGSRKFDFALNDNEVQEMEEAAVHQTSSRKDFDFDLNELPVMEEEEEAADHQTSS